MRSLALALFIVATAACEGSEMRRPLGTGDLPPDGEVDDDAETADGDDDGDDALPDGEDTADGLDGEVGPDLPTLTFWFEGQGGELGRGDDEVVLMPADEPERYRGIPGFQIDLALETERVAQGEEVRYYIDDALVALSSITLIEDELGGARLEGANIPDRDAPVEVRVEVMAQGELLVASKLVDFGVEPCVITAELTVNEAGCVALEASDLVAPFEAARVLVTRTTGECAAVGGTATLGETVITLAESAFSEDGTATLVVPIDPASGFTGELALDLLAPHPIDPSLDATAQVAARLDLLPPGLAWVRPPVEQLELTLAEDADGDPDNGLQYELRVALTLEEDEPFGATLTVADEVASELIGQGGGELSFGTITFTEDGPVSLAAAVADGCGNLTTLERELLVTAIPETIAIVAPADGAVLLAAADGDPATTEVYDTAFTVAATSAEAGTRLEILCQPADTPDPDAWTVVGQDLVAQPSPDGTYLVAVQADVRIVGQAARCVATMDTPEPLVSEPLRLTFAVPPPALVITAPTDGACLATDTLGFAGTAANLAGGPLELGGTSPNPEDGPIIVTDFATVSDAGDWSGTYALGDDDGPWAFTVSGADAFGNPAEASVALVIDRVAPTLAITAPPDALDGDVTPDADPATPGYQASVVVNATEATTPGGGEVCLVVNGGAPTCQALAETVTFDGITFVAGDNVLTVTGRDGCGNTAEPASRTVAVTLVNPIAIVAPADGATLLAAGDADPASATVYDLTVTLDADRAEAGAALLVECRATGGAAFTQVGARTITTVAENGVYDLDVAVDTSELTTSVECRARVDLPNPGVSALVAWVLALPPPTLTVTAPTAGQCHRADIAAAGAASALDGRTVTATLVELDGDPVASAAGPADADSWAVTIPLGQTPDGSYGVVASATDAFGNPASSGAAVGVVVDRTRPVVALTAPADPDITEADDTSTAAGVQVDVVATYQDARPGDVSPPAAAATVCLALGLGAATCQAAAATVTFSAVTLQPGDNILTISATDACGNTATPAVVTRRLELDAPTVVISTPAEDLSTAATAIDIVVTVTDDGAPLSGLDVTLLAGGTDTGLTPTGAADGTYTFAAVPLAPGAATTFIAEAERPNSALGVSGPRVVTQKNVQPTITITSPTDEALFVLASPECAAGQTNCVTTVSATTTNAEDGSVATLAVACGGPAGNYNGTVANNAVSFTGVVLTDGETCTLTPSVTDLVEQSATGTAIDVTVDRTAPTIVITSPDAILQGDTDDADDTTAGMQHALGATLGGVASGAVVTATLSWDDGGPQEKSLEHTVTADVPDGGAYAATFAEPATPGLVTWPEGLVTLTVSVSDANGNLTTVELDVAVDSDAAIRITGPTTVPADSCGAGCAAGTVCASGTCWIAWGTGASRQLVTVVDAVETTTDNVRVCSDDPALSSTGAAVCASSPSVTGSFREVMRVSSGGGITVIDVSSALLPGAQRLVAEVLPIPGGAWVSSQSAVSATERERRVFVDLVTPTVSALDSPSDDLDPLGTLNAAEQEEVPRAYDIRFTTDEPGSAEVFVNGVVAGTLDVPSAGQHTVRVTLPEGSPQVWVVMRDAVGNTSPATPGLGALTYQPTVDVTAPTLVFTRPASSPLKLGDDLDVVLSSNAEGRTVTVFDATVEVASGVVSAGSLTFDHATFNLLSDGSHTLTATVSDAALNPTTAATAPETVVVDTVPPSGTIIEPADFTEDLVDADPGTPGFQVTVVFSTADGATSWQLASSKGCNLQFDNCQDPVVEATGAVTNPDGQEPSVDITLDLDAAVTRQKIILTTFDVAGNTHTFEVRIQIVVTCAISFRNLPTSGWYNTSSCATPDTSCASAEVSIEVGLAGTCGAVNHLRLFDGATELAEIPNPAATETFVVTFDDGAALQLETKAYQGANELVSTGVVPIGVDLTLPAVSFVSTTIQGFVTAADGESVSWGFAEDLDPNTAGMQFHAAVQVTDTNVDGGVITTLSATGSQTVALDPTNGDIPLALAGTSPITQQLLGMTLTDLETHAVTVTATDAAGNADSSSFTATVDVTQPEIVTVTDFEVDRRRPRITLSWTAVGEDELPAAYEIRYARLAPILTEDDWDAACDASLVFGSDPMPPPAPAGQAMTTSFGGPDTRAFSDTCKLDVRFDDASPLSEVALYVVVRARDSGGNYSPLDPASTVEILNADLFNDVSLVRFDNTGNTFGANGLLITRRGSILGDLTGDGRAEWVAFSPNTNGFCVMRGLASLPATTTISALSGPDHTCLIGADAGAIFPGVTQTGHHVVSLGDLNGDGLGDFGVSGRITNGSTSAAGEGYVAVYLGQAGVLPDLTQPNLRFRGIRIGSGGAYGAEYTGFCSTGDFDGLVTNTLTTDDLVIAETFASTVHVIPGQTTWNAATNLTFDLSVAGTVSNAPPTGLGAWSVAAIGNWGVTEQLPQGSPIVLGRRCARAGDVLATPTGLGTGAKDDLLVLQSGSSDARVFLFPGRSFSAGTTVTVSESAAAAVDEDTRSLRLRQDTAALVPGFGTSHQGRFDLTGDGVADVVIGHSPRRLGALFQGLPTDGRSIFIFDGAKLQALVGQDVRVGATGAPVGDTYTGTNGWVIVSELNTSVPFTVRVVGDFDGWLAGDPAAPRADLLIGDNAGRTLQLRLNHLRPAASIVLGQFPVLDGEIVNRYRAPDTDGSIGTWVDGGEDMSGDGLIDLISGSNLGDVVIVH